MQIDAAQFADLIAGLEARGLTRPEIARRTGLSKNTVWRMANGEVREPAYGTVAKLQALDAKWSKRHGR